MFCICECMYNIQKHIITILILFGVCIIFWLQMKLYKTLSQQSQFEFVIYTILHIQIQYIPCTIYFGIYIATNVYIIIITIYIKYSVVFLGYVCIIKDPF